jgi:hypothetical protein
MGYVDYCSWSVDVVEKQGRKPLHTDFQTAALVAGLFREHFDADLNSKGMWTASALRIRNSLPQRYLFDMVSAFCRGSAEGKVYQFVQNRRILEGVEPSAITSTLEGWFSASCAGTLKRDEIDQTAELLLKYFGAAALRLCGNSDKSSLWCQSRRIREYQSVDPRRWNASNVLLDIRSRRASVEPCGSLRVTISA